MTISESMPDLQAAMFAAEHISGSVSQRARKVLEPPPEDPPEDVKHQVECFILLGRTTSQPSDLLCRMTTSVCACGYDG